MINSSCFAGVDSDSLSDLNTDNILDLPAAEAASFPQTATIKSIAIKGINNKIPPYYFNYFINSNIAASNVLSVSILHIHRVTTAVCLSAYLLIILRP